MANEAEDVEELWRDKLEGRVRAIEALISEMPGVTEARIAAAKERIRKNAKGRLGSWSATAADLRDRIGRPLDEHAEAALDNLASELKSRN
jgi:hypothetical protein